MLGIDTNVLVRYIVQDDAKQAGKATQFLEQTCSIAQPALINGIILCELVWVLESAYAYPRLDIISVLECILKIRQFHIHEPDILWRALRAYAKSNADFADHYVVELNHHYGCASTVTFDKKAAQLVHAELLE